jgi:hypothetical protein
MTPPFLSNAISAQRADKALLTYVTAARCTVEDGLGDLLRDLMFWSKAAHLDFARALARAEQQFDETAAGRGQ